MRREILKTRRAAARTVAALLFMLAAVSAGGCGDPYVQGGEMHFDAARYDKAATAFEQAVAKNPNDARAHMWLARCYAELSRVSDAVLEFDRAVSLNGGLADDAAGYRRRYWRQQELRGESFLREALSMPESSAQRIERLNQADEALTQALLLSDDSGLTYFQFYKLHTARGETNEALKNLNLALARAEGDGDLTNEIVPVLRERGRQAVLAGDYEEGVRDYTAAARLRAADVDLKMDLASALLLHAESSGIADADRDSTYREAGRVLEEVRRLRPLEPDALYNLATVRVRMQDYAGAGDLLLQYLALRPHDSEAWRLFAEAARAEKKDGRARTADLAARVVAINRPVGDTAEWARRAAERFGPGTDLGALYGELGAPGEIHTIKEGKQSLIEVWFWLHRGRVAAFQDGRGVGEPLTLGQGK